MCIAREADALGRRVTGPVVSWRNRYFSPDRGDGWRWDGLLVWQQHRERSIVREVGGLAPLKFGG